MATSDRTGAVTVTIGGQVRFQMKSKKRIREAFNENDRVVQVLADATDPTTLILVGRAAGTSRLELTDADNGKESYLIVVQRDVEMLRNLIRKTLPSAMIDITPIGDSGTNVILSGYVAKEEDRETARLLAQALGLQVAVNSVSVGGGGNVPHVQLDLTLARVSRSRARSRGASWIINGTDFSIGSLLGGLTALQAAGAAAGGLGLGVVPSPATTVPAATANIIAGFAPSQIQLLLAALKTEGLAKLVSAPTIVARSGEEADLLVGGQVPVISAAAGINGPGVTYRPVGTELRFLPVVYGNGKIHLTVSPRVTAVNNAQALATNFGTSPSFEEQRMTTSVIVEPGQTIAIGGLIQTTQQGTVNKIPHLGDIPYLGALFSYATQTEEEIELVILLTPRLVDPADCHQMPKALPGSETRKPDDFEFYLETVLEAPRGQRMIWAGHEYIPAWKSGPSADIYPCPGGCAPGTNAPPATTHTPESKTPARGGAAPSKTTAPRNEPPIAATDVYSPNALIYPKDYERKTVWHAESISTPHAALARVTKCTVSRLSIRTKRAASRCEPCSWAWILSGSRRSVRATNTFST
jgi:pilus assembly protein CpaC